MPKPGRADDDHDAIADWSINRSQKRPPTQTSTSN